MGKGSSEQSRVLNTLNLIALLRLQAIVHHEAREVQIKGEKRREGEMQD